MTYSFTSQFSSPSLRQRVGMMNNHRSGFWSCWRYGSWMLLMAGMAIACRHRPDDTDTDFIKQNRPPFPLTNPTRVLAAELEKPQTPWFRQATLVNFTKKEYINGRQINFVPINMYSPILRLQDNRLALKLPDGQQASVFINGQSVPISTLSTLTFEQVADLFVYQKIDDFPGASDVPESYRIFISTTHKTSEVNPLRIKWKRYLLANAVSAYPGGNSSTFSMNKLLEATFFHNKLAFVERTEDEHLRLYDEFAKDIEIWINGIRVDKKQLNAVHVREVDKLYTRERAFEEWADGPDRKTRFVLYVQTAPKRARRDSSYYVFSPFYSGDF